jgi:hypothetical protein
VNAEAGVLTWTKEEVLEGGARARDIARDLFVRDGKLLPRVLFYATVDPETGAPSKTLGMLPVQMGKYEGDAKGKNELSQFIRFTAARVRAVGLLFVSECWVLPAYRMGTRLANARGARSAMASAIGERSPLGSSPA